MNSDKYAPLLFALMFVLNLGCGGIGEAQHPIDFRHAVIDGQPDTGVDCCTDVCALGDLNRDGLQDVIIGAENASTNGVVWYENPTWKKRGVAIGEFTTDGRIADVNGDGAPDIVISSTDDGVSWFENSAWSSEAHWPRHKVYPNYAHDVLVGDIDGDGDSDVITCDKKRIVASIQVGPDTWHHKVIIEKKGEGIGRADVDYDNDLDIIYGATWLEAPNDPLNQDWNYHVIDVTWPEETRVSTADMNADGRTDVVLTASEGKGDLAWFETPISPKTELWNRHQIDTGLEGAHSLKVADMDNDGDLDIVTAEMHTSPQKRIMIYHNQGDHWTRQILSCKGSHNLQVSDLDGDGDFDIVGKNYGGPNRVIEMWENLTRTAPNVLALDRWEYVAVDSRRPGDQMGKMGLVFTKVNRDSYFDIVAGSYVYINPGDAKKSQWQRNRLPNDIDVLFATDVDDDQFADLIGLSRNKVLWLEAGDADGAVWSSHDIGQVPEGRTQGYATGQIVAGGKPELAFTRGKNLYYMEILPNAGIAGRWPIKHISSAVEEEGIALGDIDRDGDLDIAAYDHQQGENEIIWFANPGIKQEKWVRHKVGSATQWLDRISLADIDGDGRLDIVSTEETQDRSYNANVFWLQAPHDPTQSGWIRHHTATLRSVNSMACVDMDGDGDIDIIVAEHTDQGGNAPAANNATLIYENRHNGASWKAHIVDEAPYSSHLGTRLADLDNDGDLDIVSIGWQQYTHVHLWQNHAPRLIAESGN